MWIDGDRGAAGGWKVTRRSLADAGRALGNGTRGWRKGELGCVVAEQLVLFGEEKM
jgi:hypothetical protein